MPAFVLDADRKPLTPCHPAVARELLATGKAAVLRRCPFTIILKRRAEVGGTELLRLKVDPGSRISGIVIMNDRTGQVIFAAEIQHRGQRVRKALVGRRALRRSRRDRKTRYRKPRFDNRRRPEGWLPPSIESRVANLETWVGRLQHLSPIGAISLELARFDTQALMNPEMSGVAYQQGELAGYEVREYLLEKWGRRCAYCGMEGVPLNIEHIQPTSRGGSDRVPNLTLACEPCNQEKGNRPVEEFLVRKPELLQVILTQAKAPLTHAAAVNTARWEVLGRLKATGLPVETGTGGRTKYNRIQRGLPKTHWLDAACVGASTPERLSTEKVQTLVVRAMGHGRRRRCLPDRFGFPKGHAPQSKRFFGFQTGDLVRAAVPRGKHAGVHVGRAVVRKSGSFLVGMVDGIRWKYCQRPQRADGYDYEEMEALRCLSTTDAGRLLAEETR